MKRLLPAVLALGLSSCVSPRTCTTLVPEPPPDKDAVQVTFLGVGGLIIRWQGSAVMAAPLYSNPTIGEIALSEIHTDRQRIDALMREDVSGVRAIFTGHAHYDHLMDVPYVALHKAKDADLVGNNAMVKLLDPIKERLGPQQKLVSLESPWPASYDVPQTRFRIRAVVSQHSPQIGPRLIGWLPRLLGLFIQFPKVTLWRGEDEEPAKELPVRAGTWPAGTTQAFVIELLDADGTVAFRIYYQDSPTREPVGYPPACLPGRPVDLAILCVGGATELPRFPADIVRALHPGFVLGVHWEDFFEPRPIPIPGAKNVRERIKLLPGVSRSGFLRAVRKALPSGGRAAFPCPEAVTYFTRTGAGWSIGASDAEWSAPKR
jgi:hypothetical protein